MSPLCGSSPLVQGAANVTLGSESDFAAHGTKVRRLENFANPAFYAEPSLDLTAWLCQSVSNDFQEGLLQ
ncbi:hypothetical protein SAMN04488118_11714 [Epibacterium ulvae]|uniref:Uncharacterized protein n=1 Tax=Epibacterium ulvae TaxID=1156985 RepID=A0A1G5RH80_9RHOB|nr:hypothetical protein SAMN04488118_11714 [Epibacterium ulvae]